MSIDMFAPAPAKAGRVGQATEVAKARAATEVQGAIYIARQFPRDVDQARARMLAACAQVELAEKAFYSYPRGKETISGLTIDAACELALAWGNLEFGLEELRRDDDYGQSETQAWAWDLETNTRISNTFIVPHVRDAGSSSYRVKASRDIYEVVANMGNRRMRAAILKLLPGWFRVAAENALKDTLKRAAEAEGKPLEQRIAEAVAGFGKRFGITRDQLSAKANKPVSEWTAADLTELQNLWRTLGGVENKPEEAFPDSKITAEEILGGAPEPPADEGAAEHDHFDADVYYASCPACRALSAAADREAAQE